MTNNQRAQNWQPNKFSHANKEFARAVKNPKNKSLQKLVAAINEIFAGYCSELYGTASQQKYIVIVDLIIKRMYEDMSEVFSDLLSENFDSLKSNLIDIINEEKEKNKIEIDSKEFVNVLISTITEYFDFSRQNTIDNLNKILNNSYESETISKKSKNDKKENKEEKEEKELEEKFKKIEKQISESIGNIAKKTEDAIELYNKISNKFKKEISQILSFIKIPEKIFQDTSEVDDIVINFVITKKQKKINKLIKNCKKEIIETVDNLITDKITKPLENIKKRIKIIVNIIVKIINKAVSVISKAVIKLLMTRILVFSLISIALNSLLSPIFKKYINPWYQKIQSWVDKILGICTKLSEIIGDILTSILDLIKPAFTFLFDVIGDVLVSVIQLMRKLINPFLKLIIFLSKNILKIVEIIVKILQPIAKLLGEFLVLLVLKLGDILISIANSIKPFAKLLGTIIIFLIITTLQFRIAIYKAIKPIAKELGSFLAFAAVGVLNILTIFAKVLKPVAKTLGKIYGSLIIVLAKIAPIIVALVNTVGLLLFSMINILDKLFSWFGVGALARKLAYKAGQAYEEFALKTVKTLTEMLEKSNDPYNEAKNTADVILHSLKDFMNYLKKYITDADIEIDKVKKDGILNDPAINEIISNFKLLRDEIKQIEPTLKGIINEINKFDINQYWTLAWSSYYALNEIIDFSEKSTEKNNDGVESSLYILRHTKNYGKNLLQSFNNSLKSLDKKFKYFSKEGLSNLQRENQQCVDEFIKSLKTSLEFHNLSELSAPPKLSNDNENPKVSINKSLINILGTKDKQLIGIKNMSDTILDELDSSMNRIFKNIKTQKDTIATINNNDSNDNGIGKDICS